MKLGPDITRIAALIGEPARANMLSALMGGQALTAGELAREAGITPQTASSHLAQLEAGGLVTSWDTGLDLRLFHLDESRTSLEMRVERIETGFAWAEEPPTRTRHLVSNVRVRDGEDPGTVNVRSNLLLYHTRWDRPQYTNIRMPFPGPPPGTPGPHRQGARRVRVRLGGAGPVAARPRRQPAGREPGAGPEPACSPPYRAGTRSWTRSRRSRLTCRRRWCTTS